jgi:hypothetical protein
MWLFELLFLLCRRILENKMRLFILRITTTVVIQSPPTDIRFTFLTSNSFFDLCDVKRSASSVNPGKATQRLAEVIDFLL